MSQSDRGACLVGLVSLTADFIASDSFELRLPGHNKLGILRPLRHGCGDIDRNVAASTDFDRTLHPSSDTVFDDVGHFREFCDPDHSPVLPALHDLHGTRAVVGG